MDTAGKKAFMVIFLTAALVMSLAVFMSCKVGEDSPKSETPTGPGEPIDDQDPWRITGTLSITPSEETLTVSTACAGGGLFTLYTATGGEAPYYWTHSNEILGHITPVDEDGDGVHNQLKYTLNNTCVSGDDTIILVDGNGDMTTASFTKEVEEEEVEELAVNPSSATVADGNDIILSASGGVSPYLWNSSNETALSTVGGDTGSPKTFQATNTGTEDIVVTVTVIDSVGSTATAEITVTP